jgi:antiviral helicase SLH1
MSPSAIDSAEAQWLAQLAAMRAALTDLKLPPAQLSGDQGRKFEEELDFDEDLGSGPSGDDVWDFIADEEEDEYSSDLMDGVDAPAETPVLGYGLDWLQDKCISFAQKKQGLSAEDLQGQIVALLASDSGEEEIQSTLTDIIGFDDFDFIIELISHRSEIIPSLSFASKPKDNLLGKLQTRREREEALRKQDYEHKHAALAPALNRDGPHYPHVYKTHSAGNTLSHSGKKYALPAGSERKEHDVSLCRS